MNINNCLCGGMAEYTSIKNKLFTRSWISCCKCDTSIQLHGPTADAHYQALVTKWNLKNKKTK